MSKKHGNKDIRAPIDKEPNEYKMSQADKIRIATGRQQSMDLSYYNNLPEYEGKTIFWENDENGIVEKWLHLGAALVPRRNMSIKEFKGFTDRAESEWVCMPVGKDDNGKTILAYALFLPEEEYHALRIQPDIDRQKEIERSMGIGKIAEESKAMPNVKGIKTYAPNLPTGGQGLSIEHDV